MHTYIHTNLYSAKNRENESEALAQDDWTVKADWKRWNFRWRLTVDRVSIERMHAGREFQVEGAEQASQSLFYAFFEGGFPPPKKKTCKPLPQIAASGHKFTVCGNLSPTAVGTVLSNPL